VGKILVKIPKFLELSPKLGIICTGKGFTMCFLERMFVCIKHDVIYIYRRNLFEKK
jgi:hypothetical protein